MTDEQIRITFTSRLSELTGRGIPVRKAVRDIGNSKTGKKMQTLCGEVGKGLEEGRRLSSVLATCLTIHFPRWYTAFVAASESKDCMGESFAFLAEIMKSRQKSFVSFCTALIYPVTVALICFAASIWAVCMYPSYFENDSIAYTNGAAGSFFLSGLFMLTALFFSVMVLRMVTQPNPCLALMHVLAFLTEKGTSLRESLECAIPVVEKNERLCDAVLAIRDSLLRGEAIESAFSGQLEEAGFSSAAKLIASNVALAESGGGENVFARTAKALAGKADALRTSVLSCEQPVLLACAAVYMLILLKNTLMPYLTGGGLGI